MPPTIRLANPRMASPSIQFRKLFVRLSVLDRINVVSALDKWTNTITSDPRISQFQNFLSHLQGLYELDSKQLVNHSWIWSLANGLNDCVSFQQVVRNKLAPPKNDVNGMFDKTISVPRKTIPKKIREEVWRRDNVESISGKCYCCSQSLSALGDWHAGHIIAQCKGGADTSDNLRVVCIPCNLAMGTENMDDFRRRCYPSA